MSEGYSRSNGCGSCLAAPFVAIWRLLLAIIGIVGRLAAALIGIVLVILGVVMSLTVIGALIGIPLIIFGVLLMARALF